MRLLREVWFIYMFCGVFATFSAYYPGAYPGISFTRGIYRSRPPRSIKISLNLLFIIYFLLTYLYYLLT